MGNSLKYIPIVVAITLFMPSIVKGISMANSTALANVTLESTSFFVEPGFSNTMQPKNDPHVKTGDACNFRSDDRLLSHRFAGQYLQCDPRGHYVDKYCALGTRFSPRRQVCVIPGSVFHEDATSSSPTSGNVNKSVPASPSYLPVNSVPSHQFTIGNSLPSVSVQSHLAAATSTTLRSVMSANSATPNPKPLSETTLMSSKGSTIVSAISIGSQSLSVITDILSFTENTTTSPGVSTTGMSSWSFGTPILLPINGTPIPVGSTAVSTLAIPTNGRQAPTGFLTICGTYIKASPSRPSSTPAYGDGVLGSLLRATLSNPISASSSWTTTTSPNLVLVPSVLLSQSVIPMSSIKALPSFLPFSSPRSFLASTTGVSTGPSSIYGSSIFPATDEPPSTSRLPSTMVTSVSRSSGKSQANSVSTSIVTTGVKAPATGVEFISSLIPTSTLSISRLRNDDQSALSSCTNCTRRPSVVSSSIPSALSSPSTTSATSMTPSNSVRTTSLSVAKITTVSSNEDMSSTSAPISRNTSSSVLLPKSSTSSTFSALSSSTTSAQPSATISKSSENSSASGSSTGFYSSPSISDMSTSPPPSYLTATTKPSTPETTPPSTSSHLPALPIGRSDPPGHVAPEHATNGQRLAALAVLAIPAAVGVGSVAMSPHVSWFWWRLSTRFGRPIMETWSRLLDEASSLGRSGIAHLTDEEITVTEDVFREMNQRVMSNPAGLKTTEFINLRKLFPHFGTPDLAQMINDSPGWTYDALPVGGVEVPPIPGIPEMPTIPEGGQGCGGGGCGGGHPAPPSPQPDEGGLSAVEGNPSPDAGNSPTGEGSPLDGDGDSVDPSRGHPSLPSPPLPEPPPDQEPNGEGHPPDGHSPAPEEAPNPNDPWNRGPDGLPKPPPGSSPPLPLTPPGPYDKASTPSTPISDPPANFPNLPDKIVIHDPATANINIPEEFRPQDLPPEPVTHYTVKPEDLDLRSKVNRIAIKTAFQIPGPADVKLLAPHVSELGKMVRIVPTIYERLPLAGKIAYARANGETIYESVLRYPDRSSAGVGPDGKPLTDDFVCDADGNIVTFNGENVEEMRAANEAARRKMETRKPGWVRDVVRVNNERARLEMMDKGVREMKLLEAQVDRTVADMRRGGVELMPRPPTPGVEDGSLAVDGGWLGKPDVGVPDGKRMVLR